MFPSILCAAVYTGQTKKLELLKNRYEADLSAADYDGRTPLHIAASEGKKHSIFTKICEKIYFCKKKLEVIL